MDAWIGVVGAAVGALAALGGQWINSKTTERVAYRDRQHGVLDDLSRKLAALRQETGFAQMSGGQVDSGLVEALRALTTISPSIHDDELQKRVNALIETAWRFRTAPFEWKSFETPYQAVRERLTEVYKALG